MSRTITQPNTREAYRTSHEQPDAGADLGKMLGDFTPPRPAHGHRRSSHPSALGGVRGSDQQPSCGSRKRRRGPETVMSGGDNSVAGQALRSYRVTDRAVRPYREVLAGGENASASPSASAMVITAHPRVAAATPPPGRWRRGSTRGDWRAGRGSRCTRVCRLGSGAPCQHRSTWKTPLEIYWFTQLLLFARLIPSFCSSRTRRAPCPGRRTAKASGRPAPVRVKPGAGRAGTVTAPSG